MAFLVAAVMHAGFVALFVRWGVTELAWFNGLSVVMQLAAFAAVRRGWALTSYGLGVIEIYPSSRRSRTRFFFYRQENGNSCDTDFTAPRVLFPSWSQPIVTSEPCQQCVFADFSLAVFGSRVSP